MRYEESPVAVLLKEGKAMPGMETVAERPDGTRVRCVNHPTPLRDASGRIVGALNLLVDATERNNAVIASNRLAAIVEGSDDAIVSKTLDGIITSWNEGASRIFGYTAQDMVGQPVTTIIPAELWNEEQKIADELNRGQRVKQFDTIRLAKDGRRIDVSVTISPIFDAVGNIIGASKFARDITERKRTEKTLERATALAQQARIEADRANSAKTEFLAVMSHEIRTPLTSINGCVDLLSRTGKLTRKQRHYIELVETANAALLSIVDDILDFSKVEAGQLELEKQPFSAKTLIHDTVAIMRPAAAKKNIILKYKIERSVSEWLIGDEGRLRRVLLNLLGNAVKFTESGSISLSVQAGSSNGGDERIRFAVADTGVGIRPEQQNRLFKRFSQADPSVSRRHGGTGLGLAICKHLVELMDGEIGVVSEPGRGTTVWFTAHLPTTTEPAHGAAPEQPPADAGPGKARILVVDDIDANREIVGAYLEYTGYHVDAVGSAPEAFGLLARAPFDLVLMDIQMPDMDGITATKWIRALDSPIKNIPIIAMTGSVLPQQVKLFLEAGMNDHVGKPIERAKLYNKIWRWLPRAERSGEPVASNSPHFNRSKFNELLDLIDSDGVEHTIARFVEVLSACFKSTPEAARLEAHDILNIAGVLGFDSFVVLCRDLEQAPPDDAERLRASLEQIRGVQAIVLRTLSDELLPELRANRPVIPSYNGAALRRQG